MEPDDSPGPSNQELCQHLAVVLTRALGHLHDIDFCAFINDYANNRNGKIVRKTGINEAGFKLAALAVLEAQAALYNFRVITSEYEINHRSSVDLRIVRDGHPPLLLELKHVSPSYMDTVEQPALSYLGEKMKTANSGIRKNRQAAAFRRFCAKQLAQHPVASHERLIALGGLSLYVSEPGAKRAGKSTKQRTMFLIEYVNAAVQNQFLDYMWLEHARDPSVALDGALLLSVGNQAFAHHFCQYPAAPPDADALAEEMAELAVSEEEEEEEEKKTPK